MPALATPPRPRKGSLTALDSIASTSLRPLASRIDREGFYPEDVLRELGEAGAFSFHIDPFEPSFTKAVDAISTAGRFCGSTAFLMWCHNACAWYLTRTANAALRARWLPWLATGQKIGATALSNPMKNASGFESLKLTGRTVRGGYQVSGQLPWVSNLADSSICAIVFQAEKQSVMALVETAKIQRKPTAEFAALEGTATFALNFTDVFIPDEQVIAAPAGPFLKLVRPGFVLLQTGIALGLMRGAIDDIRRANTSLGHTNTFLPHDADAIGRELSELQIRIEAINTRILDPHDDPFLEVAGIRLDAAHAALRAAESALWHNGAKGFLRGSSSERRVREALFVTLLTPSIKHLQKELAGTAAKSA